MDSQYVFFCTLGLVQMSGLKEIDPKKEEQEEGENEED